MKKLLLFVIIFCSAVFIDAFGQSSLYKPFKVDLGISTIITIDEMVGNGSGMYIHPVYNLTDRLSIGSRLEWAYVLQDDPNLISAAFNNGIITLSSVHAVIDYYLSTGRRRFFVGLGTGITRHTLIIRDFSSFQIDSDRISITVSGLMPRVGFNVGHFKMSANYILTGDIQYHSLNFTLGIEIGGGMK